MLLEEGKEVTEVFVHLCAHFLELFPGTLIFPSNNFLEPFPERVLRSSYFFHTNLIKLNMNMNNSHVVKINFKYVMRIHVSNNFRIEYDFIIEMPISITPEHILIRSRVFCILFHSYCNSILS